MRNVPRFWRLPLLIVVFMVCLLQTALASCDAVDSRYRRRKQCEQLAQSSWLLQPSLLAASQVMDGDVSKAESNPLCSHHQITTVTSSTNLMNSSSSWSSPSVDHLGSKVSLKGFFGGTKEKGSNNGPSVPINGQTPDHENPVADDYIPDPDVELKLARALELLNSYSVLTHQVVAENEALEKENVRLQRTANNLAIQRNVAIGGAAIVIAAAIFSYGVFR